MQDDEIKPPTKRFFKEISPGRHRHQQALSKFIVQTYVAAHLRGIHVIDFHPENTFRIDCGERPIFPDAHFKLSLPNGTKFTYCVELDNSTERVFSYKDNDSITSKMQRYLVDMVGSPDYRVLFVITGANERKQNIIEAARQLTSGTGFVPFYIVSLNEYLSERDALFTSCFHSPQDENIPLLRSQTRQFNVHRRILETPALV